MSKSLPVILDTDIGIDMDDTWALGFLLQCKELDMRLLTVATGDTEYRAKIAAKFLAGAGYTTPIGIGKAGPYPAKTQEEWVKDYDLRSYIGAIHNDGVGALIETVMSSVTPITIICIGPLTNIAEAMERCPSIADKASIVSMSGSIHKGLDGVDGSIAEYNIEQDIKAAQKVFSGRWPISITPLDTCGIVRLKGDNYKKIHDSKNIIARLIMQNYASWTWKHDKFATESSVLFDTVAVYMAYCLDLLKMQHIKVRITDDGFMREDANGKEVHCALEWRDLAAFERYLTEKLS